MVQTSKRWRAEAQTQRAQEPGRGRSGGCAGGRGPGWSWKTVFCWRDHVRRRQSRSRWRELGTQAPVRGRGTLIPKPGTTPAGSHPEAGSGWILLKWMPVELAELSFGGAWGSSDRPRWPELWWGWEEQTVWRCLPHGRTWG